MKGRGGHVALYILPDGDEKGSSTVDDGAYSKFVQLSNWVHLAIAVFVIMGITSYLRAVVLFRTGPAAPGGDIECPEALYQFDGNDSIVIMPFATAHVSRAEPYKVFPEDQHLRSSSADALSPHLRVSDDILTILQFRTVDVDTDHCALALLIPPTDDDSPQTDGDARGIQLDVCALDNSHPLDVRTLSWANRPHCRTHIGTLPVRTGEEVRLPEFPCTRASVHTFEISCAPSSPGCTLDLLGIRSTLNTTLGVFMRQLQAI
ncbi:hypothetical protein A0H81_04834 [Grifola frondosa]|uniref:Ubiquitin 3 binding protein But2 C-terminal domain-containing protein n=1 Tax=Grifola frondosa TaxID=5627 RepID=A0A1C7MFJ8_GRIFR|nr:hypothetical protein A0H81_04834 [Grifola frondosa]